MGITKKYKSPITIQGIARRIWKREGNIYKLEVIQNILRMYFDECEKALENGERVGLSKIGSLSPRVHTKLTYNIPSMNAEEGNKPYTSLKFTRGCANKEKMDIKYRKNIKNGFPGLGEDCQCDQKQINTLIERGFLNPDKMIHSEPDGEGDMENEKTGE